MLSSHRGIFVLVSTAVSLGFALTVFVSQNHAMAQEADEQAAESGGVYTMPRGDFASEPREGAEPEAIPRPGTPYSEEELRRLKELPGDVPSGPAQEVPERVAPALLLRQCATNIATGFAPPDTHGAVTPTTIVMVTNVDIGVYSKNTCGIISRVPLRTFFAAFGIPATEILFDPRALYDRLTGRCLVVAESRNSGNTDQFLYIAGSTTSSCTSWNLRRFVLSRGASRFCKRAANNFYDFPNAGYNIRRLVVTSNNFASSSGGFLNSTVLSIDKLALYLNGNVRGRCFDTGSIFGMTPAVVGDRNSSMFILSRPAGSTIVRRRLITSPFGPTGSRGDVLVTTPNITVPFTFVPPDAVQPNGQRLDTIDGRFVSASKQIGGFLWNAHSVNVGSFSRWRLYKLSTTGTAPLFIFTPTTSTCARRDHLFLASVDTNSTLTSAPIFVTATRTCPSQAVAGRAAHLIFRGPNSSPSGWIFHTVRTSETNFTTTNTNPGRPTCNNAPRGSCRWGDYSSTQIDPSFTSRAWGFNELITGAAETNWTTRGAQVQ